MSSSSRNVGAARQMFLLILCLVAGTALAADNDLTTQARKILDETGIQGGIVVHLGCGNGNRVHGDHEPVEDRYPVRLWDEGDIVIDRQELTVPGNYRPGNYSIFIGLFAGDTRMAITDGPSASENRVRAGVMVVR